MSTEAFTFFLDPAEHKAISTAATPVIAVKVGETGYWPIRTRASVADLNPPDMTAEVRASAFFGSLFGWSCPGGRPRCRIREGPLIMTRSQLILEALATFFALGVPIMALFVGHAFGL